MKNIKRVYPDYDPKQGYERAGLIWFQGWNDKSDSHTSPNENWGAQVYPAGRDGCDFTDFRGNA
jgi:hypothetical protein